MTWIVDDFYIDNKQQSQVIRIDAKYSQMVFQWRNNYGQMVTDAT